MNIKLPRREQQPSPSRAEIESAPPGTEPVVEAAGWSVVAATAKGGSHRLNGRPNQDAHVTLAAGDSVVLVVADGHGSDKSFRSDRGSLFATVAGRWLADQILEVGTHVSDVVELEAVLPGLTEEMVRQWQEQVRGDEARDRLLPGCHPHWPSERPTDEDLLHAYGSTFLLAVLGADTAVFLQVGDGDMAVRDRDGRTWCPVPGDDRLVANQTTSLCNVDVTRDVRHAVIDTTVTPLTVVLLSTDGYGNAFEDEEWQPAVADDLAELVASEGISWVAEHLPEWAEDAAMTAGDDVTVVLGFT